MTTTLASIAPPRPHSCRRHRVGSVLVWLVGWLLAAFAATATVVLPLDVGESLCGVWGCYPPLPALLALHLLWAVAVAATVHTVARWWPGRLRFAGGVLLALGVSATGWVVGLNLNYWLGHIAEEYRKFWPQHAAYAVAMTNAPLVQAILIGAAALVWPRREPKPVTCGVRHESA